MQGLYYRPVDLSQRAILTLCGSNSTLVGIEPSTELSSARDSDKWVRPGINRVKLHSLEVWCINYMDIARRRLDCYTAFT